MNLCYTDAQLKQLVSYGIEGVNYEYADNGGIVVYTDNNTYAPNTNMIFGNSFLCTPKKEDIDSGTVVDSIDYDSLHFSSILGFIPNTESLQVEMAGLENAINQYMAALFMGAGTEADYEACIDLLYDNGLQTYLDEMQKQIDEWLAQKK